MSNEPATPPHVDPDPHLHGCPVELWDGPYLHRCSLGDRVLECAYHGPFERALRCTKAAGCRRPDKHGGACD